MEIIETGLAGCCVIKPTIYNDSRGYFFESYNSALLQKITGKEVRFVQDNQSFSTFGVVRGLHAQAGNYAQAKLVRVLNGSVLDVAVDIRPDSPTYGKHFSIELSGENKLQLFIPRGFLHGFAVLSKTVDFFYKCDNFYKKDSEEGIRFDSPSLNINWLVPENQQIVSQRDLDLPFFEGLNS